MADGWRQSWSDFLDSIRGKPSRQTSEPATEPQSESVTNPISAVPGSPVPITSPEPIAADAFAAATHAEVTGLTSHSGDDIPSETNGKIETAPSQPNPRRRPTPGQYAASVLAIMAIPGTLLFASSDYFADMALPSPPAPNVVATFEGGQITLEDIESHLDVLLSSNASQGTMSQDMLLETVEDLVSDQLILRWAANRKPEAEESFQHAVRHINENLNLESFADQLHTESISISESSIREYFDKNKGRYEGRSFSDVRDEIRQALIAEQEPAFVEDYIQKLRTNASIARSFELLDVPSPTQEELENYYRENVDRFKLPRRAIVDELEFSESEFGPKAQQEAANALLSLQGGTTFPATAARFSNARFSPSAEVAEGSRNSDWDKSVFTLVPGELGTVFQAGRSYFVVRLRQVVPAGATSFAEVRSEIITAVSAEKEQRWFADNGEMTLFTIKGQRYTLRQFYKEYEEAALRGQFAGAEGMKRLANALIDRMLLVSDTYDRLLDVANKPLADETRLRLLRQMMEQEEVDDRIDVTEEQIEALYSESRDRLVSPPKSRIRYIRIGLGSNEDEANRSRERADEAYGKLTGADTAAAEFASVAQEYSEDVETSSNGGEFPEWIGESGDPFGELMSHPFHEAIQGIQPGKLGTPFELGGSIYIVEVMERTAPQKLSIDEARPYIEEYLTNQQHRSMAEEMQRRQLQEAKVQLYPQVLEEYLERTASND
ncbi:peptidyl-prolyl cis-trans isomerase [Tianweitania sediminis]|uniref:Parvulin-like PPIase n=2 Tax=Tianweitania sediminis TaxID=1502156 RepID=A0A8J7UL27_9HYPH|nr:peptidyl-prolyl cis-trans isomerase [Tianweitania sediminis]